MESDPKYTENPPEFDPDFFVELGPGLFHCGGRRPPLGGIVAATVYESPEQAAAAYRSYWDRLQVYWPEAIVKTWAHGCGKVRLQPKTMTFDILEAAALEAGDE